METEKLFKIDKWKYFELINHKPHTRQKLFHSSEVRFKVPVCGRRFGKTVMGARELEPILMTPGKRVWIVGPTYDLGEKEFRIIWNDMIIKLGMGKERSVKRSYAKKQGDLSIEFPWGTRLEVRSADRPENLVGEGLDYVIMSEAAKHVEETWNRFIRPALTDKRGSATFSTTPEGQNWIYKLWKMGRDPNEPDFESWQFPSWENPYVYPGGRNDPELLLTERTTPTDVFKQEYGADFTSFSGKIYADFEENTNVRSVPFDPALPNYVCFDWGFVDYMAAIEFQVDSMQRIRIWREQYLNRVSLRDYLRIMKARTNPAGYRIDLCFGDAANPEAVQTVSTEFFPCYADPRSKSGTREGGRESGWQEGVELVQSFLKSQQVDEDEFGTPIEEPWLVVDHSCINTIREFNNYRMMGSPNGKERNAREAAIDYDNHALDAIRYGLMHVFKLGATESLSSVVNHSEMHDIPDTGYFTTNKNFA